MSEQKGSISAMASKYQDDGEGDDDEDETSSFEEVARPAPKATSHQKPPSPIKVTSPVLPRPASPVKSSFSQPISSSASTPTPAAASTGSSGVESSITEIKKLIEAQTKAIAAQGEQIATLAAEVGDLKKKVASGGSDQSERIRQLELELEEYRS